MDRTITESIEIEAPPERVFSAWTDPEQLVAWWGDDQSYRTTGWESDLRVGGKWIARGKSLNGRTFSVEGEYLRVEPPNQLVFTWNKSWSAEAETVVELEFKPTAMGTLLTVRHRGFTDGPEFESHSKGWPRVMGWMKTFVESKKAVAQ